MTDTQRLVLSNILDEVAVGGLTLHLKDAEERRVLEDLLTQIVHGEYRGINLELPAVK